MSNRDIIEDIKAKLKDAQDLPYREGAWQRFAAQNGKTKQSKVVLFKRLASIAAAGLAVLGVSLYIYNAQNTSPSPSAELAYQSVSPSTKSSSNVAPRNKADMPMAPENSIIENYSSLDYPSHETHLGNERKLVSLSNLPTITAIDLVDLSTSSFTELELKYIQPQLVTSRVTSEEKLPNNVVLTPSAMTLAHQTVQGSLNKDVDQLKQSTRMSLGDKFQLGLYVSPHRTSDRFDVGAGFLVSYAISKNISIRTGTSYNSYSVGVLKDPMETSNTERVSLSNTHKESIASDLYATANPQMILPNINAVMGRVEAIEIPLDMSYQFKKGYYTSAGISYSAIINQEREARYIDNAGISSLQDKASLIPNAAEKVNKVEVKTVKSLEDNVNPNGFSGFANFSVGKKVNLNNKMSLSLEPFVKVPIGQFRKSDLNYTNSGVRIITTF